MSATIPRGNVQGMFLVRLAFDVTSVAANTTAERTMTVPGVRLGDVCFVAKPSLNAGLGICNVRVSANDTLAITYNNNTAGAIDPGSETYDVLIVRPDVPQSALPARVPGF
ncbi:MAG: hypothetical protein IT493_11990 [Gammaproteobacteria bacterium]|nr:hypothetical protein [Gammaproteobacteria bacterium]